MPGKQSIVEQHPNAVIGGAIGGAGIGSLVVWILNAYADAGIDPTAGAAIAGGIATVILAIGKVGVGGLIRRIWSGDTPKHQ